MFRGPRADVLRTFWLLRRCIAVAERVPLEGPHMRLLLIIISAALAASGCNGSNTNNSDETSLQNLTVEHLTVNNVVTVDNVAVQPSETTTVEPSPTRTESSRRNVENQTTRVAPSPPKQPPKPRPAPEPEPAPDPHAGHDINNSINRM